MRSRTRALPHSPCCNPGSSANSAITAPLPSSCPRRKFSKSKSGSSSVPTVANLGSLNGMRLSRVTSCKIQALHPPSSKIDHRSNRSRFVVRRNCVRTCPVACPRECDGETHHHVRPVPRPWPMRARAQSRTTPTAPRGGGLPSCTLPRRPRAPTHAVPVVPVSSVSRLCSGRHDLLPLTRPRRGPRPRLSRPTT